MRYKICFECGMKFPFVKTDELWHSTNFKKRWMCHKCSMKWDIAYDKLISEENTFYEEWENSVKE